MFAYKGGVAILKKRQHCAGAFAAGAGGKLSISKEEHVIIGEE